MHPESLTPAASEALKAFLPLTVKRGKQTAPVGDTLSFNQGDEVSMLVFQPKSEEVAQWLRSHSWQRTDSDLRPKALSQASSNQ